MVLSCILFGLLFGCSSKSTDTGSTTPIECQEVLDTEEDYEERQWNCNLEPLCDYVHYDDGEKEFDSRTAAECMLQAFSDRLPGKLRLSYTDSDITSSRGKTLFILDEEGHVAQNSISYDDMVTYYYVYRPYRLKAPGYFDDCLASDSDQEMASCLFAWKEGDCVDIESTCEGAF